MSWVKHASKKGSLIKPHRQIGCRPTAREEGKVEAPFWSAWTGTFTRYSPFYFMQSKQRESGEGIISCHDPTTPK